MLILVGFLSIPAGILRNSWNSVEFLDSGRIPRIPAGISGGMESIEKLDGGDSLDDNDNYCHHASLLHVAAAYNTQWQMMMNVVVCHLVGPFAAVMFAVIHCHLVVIMWWCHVSWSHFSSDIVVLCS